MDESSSFGRPWTLDPPLRASFVMASLIETIVFVLGIVANVFSADEKTMPLLRSRPFETIGVFIGVTGCLLALWLLSGMRSHWWQADRGQPGLNITWRLALSIGNRVGTTVYYFLVFRRIADHFSQMTSKGNE